MSYTEKLNQIYEAIEVVDKEPNTYFDMEEISDLFGELDDALQALDILKKHIGVIKDYVYTTNSQITIKEFQILGKVLKHEIH